MEVRRLLLMLNAILFCCQIPHHMVHQDWNQCPGLLWLVYGIQENHRRQEPQIIQTENQGIFGRKLHMSYGVYRGWYVTVINYNLYNFFSILYTLTWFLLTAGGIMKSILFNDIKNLTEKPSSIWLNISYHMPISVLDHCHSLIGGQHSFVHSKVIKY